MLLTFDAFFVEYFNLLQCQQRVQVKVLYIGQCYKS